MNRKRVKTKVIMFLALLLVILLGIAVTLAFLKYRTDEAQNVFTMGLGVKIDLTEPKYDASTTKNNFTKGNIIDKDPTLSIPQNGMQEEYIAAKVQYIVEVAEGNQIVEKHISYTEFCANYASIASVSSLNGVIEKNMLNQGWVTVDDYETFYYGTLKPSTKKIQSLTKLQKGSTTKIFDKVVINQNYPVYDKTYDENHKEDQFINFKIAIQAYAIQGNISEEEAILGFYDSFGLSIGQ